MNRIPLILVAFLAGWMGSLTEPAVAQVVYYLARLRDLPEYRSTSQVLLNRAPAASATKSALQFGSPLVGGSASGTYLGINAASGYAGDLANYQVDGTTVYRMLSTGAVGVGLGTSTPVSPFHSSGSGGGLTVDRIAENASAPSAQFRKARGALGSETVVQASDLTANIIAGFYDGTTYRNTGNHRFAVDGAVGSNSVPTRWEVLTTPTAGPVVRLTVDSTGNVVLGTAALATTATAGFLWIPSCPGVPTGVPAATYTGRIPLVWDSAANNLYGYSGGAWQQVN